MNLPFFIANRLYFSREKSFSKFIAGVAITAVTLSLAVMIIAVSLVNGFQKEISSKVFGYFGQIQVTKFGNSRSMEDNPVSINQIFYKKGNSIENVNHIQVFAYKAGILKTDENIEGIVMKGIGNDFNWDFFEERLTEGKTFELNDSVPSDKIIISKHTANRLLLKTGDKVGVHFMQNPPRVRNLTVSGIYNSGMKEFDERYALMDIKHIQTLNNWSADSVMGFEIFLNNLELLDNTANEINYNELPNDLVAQTIRDIHPNIFDWLELQDMNKLIILILMTIVACINIITCLLIIILERSTMIGIMKTIGATNWNIRMIFIYNALYIVLAGMLLGNIFGIGICMAQMHFKFITLDEVSYYVKYAPVDLNFWNIALINLATFAICFLVLLLPSYLVSRIAPVKVLRFE
jgi:lipoprotein-releasing system permease protein